jgi:hypothetical protein
MKRPQLKLIGLLSLTAALVGCGSKSDRKSRSVANQNALSSENSASDFYSVYPPVEPDLASVKFADAALQILAIAGPGSMSVPTLSILSYENSDFVKVLRCNSDYELRSPTGKIDSLISARSDDLRWAWQEAIGAFQQCKIVFTWETRNLIPDLAASSGKFFYIVNPCIFEKNSTTKKTECSYRLQVTEPVAYVNQLDQAFLASAVELNAAEGSLAALFQELRYNARQIEFHQNLCEENAARKAANAAFWHGVKTIASVSIGAVMGGITAGPLGALEGAEKGLSVAEELFGASAKPYDGTCKQIEPWIESSKALEEKIKPASERIISIRHQLAKLNEKYLGQ